MLKAYADGTIFGERFGTGPPTVIGLHGWGRSWTDFRPVFEGLDALSVDLPGFGASPLPPEVWGAREYAKALTAVVDAIGTRVTIIGHSRGGVIAAVLATMRPEQVKCLVLTGAPLLRSHPSRKSPLPFRIARALHNNGLISEEQIERQRAKFGSADYRAASGQLRQILVKMVNESFEEELAKIQCPVRLIWGSADSAVPLQVAEDAKALLVRAEVSLQVLNGIGHDTPALAAGALRSAIDACQ